MARLSAQLECNNLDPLEPRRRQLSGAIFTIATKSLCANEAGWENWALAAEAQHYIGGLNLSPLLGQCPPLTQIGRSPYHFDIVGTVEAAREILGVSEDASVAAVRSAFKYTVRPGMNYTQATCDTNTNSFSLGPQGAIDPSSATRHSPIGAFIALCLASSNGLQPRDCYPFLSIEASTYMHMFNWQIGDCSLHSVFDEMLGQSSAESSFDALKNRSKAATKAAAAEDKLRKDLATSKKDLTLARKELVGARSSAESLRQRLSKAEASSTKVDPSAQDSLKRVEKERNEAVERARVAEQATAASSREHEKRLQALQNKVVEMAEIGRHSRLKYDEEELKRLNQIVEQQDEIFALKRDIDELRRGQSPLALSLPRKLTSPYLFSCSHLSVLSYTSSFIFAGPAAHSPSFLGAEPHLSPRRASARAQRAASSEDGGEQ